MRFEGLSDTTLANAPLLNRGFIEFATTRPTGVSGSLADRLATLSALERDRLSRAPFLLFTLDNFDLGRWQQAAAEAPRPDLFGPRMSETEWRLATTTLGVVWALARQNRYAARYLAGAGVAWCDHAASLPLPALLGAMERFERLVLPRFDAQPGIWRTLIRSTRDVRPVVRRAARLSALQSVLTHSSADIYPPARAAACSRRDGARQVAE